MFWEKMGLIFNPTLHCLPFGCFAFAQSPQALVIKDKIRIYFSTRSRDGDKYLSHITYIDTDSSFNILNVSQHRIIELGGLGCFDEHGIFPMNVIKIDEKVYAYTCGISRRVSVPVDSAIGFAISDDTGKTFKKYGSGPILSASHEEPFLVADPFVVLSDGIFKMWYIFGISWGEGDNPERVYKIAQAHSHDGINWNRESRRIIEDTFPDECQALPTVIKIDNRLHMYFCFRRQYEFRSDMSNGYRIGYAYSDDGENWIRDDSVKGIHRSGNGWDSEMMCYPHLFKMNDEIFLLYNGNEFGKYGFGVARLIDI